MLRQFFEYYRPHTRLFWVDFGSAVLSGLLELAFPLAITAFIDHLLPLGDLRLTILAAIGLLLVYLVNTALMGVVIYWGHRLGIEIETEMRRRAFSHGRINRDKRRRFLGRLCVLQSNGRRGDRYRSL